MIKERDERKWQTENSKKGHAISAGGKWQKDIWDGIFWRNTTVKRESRPAIC
jgi:hypothetical protein